MEVSIPNTQYQAQFDEIRLIIDTRKKRAYKALNNEIILSNWEIGRYVSDKIKSAKWGSKVIDMLVVYLKEKIPGIKGYEKRSIERMVRFYNEYSSVEICVSHSDANQRTGNCVRRSDAIWRRCCYTLLIGTSGLVCPS